jgi:hypothetical protein
MNPVCGTQAGFDGRVQGNLWREFDAIWTMGVLQSVREARVSLERDA